MVILMMVILFKMGFNHRLQPRRYQQNSKINCHQEKLCLRSLLIITIPLQSLSFPHLIKLSLSLYHIILAPCFSPKYITLSTQPILPLFHLSTTFFTSHFSFLVLSFSLSICSCFFRSFSFPYSTLLCHSLCSLYLQSPGGIISVRGKSAQL